MYFCHGVACEYFGTYGTWFHVVHVLDFGRSQICGQCTSPKPLGHQATTISRKFNLYVLWRRTLAYNLGPPKNPPCGQKWLLPNNHTALGTLRSAALIGSQSRRRTTSIWNPRVPGVLDRLDMWTPWVNEHVSAPRNRAPAMSQLPLCLRGRFLSLRLGKGHSNRKPTALWSPQPS